MSSNPIDLIPHFSVPVQLLSPSLSCHLASTSPKAFTSCFTSHLSRFRHASASLFIATSRLLRLPHQVLFRDDLLISLRSHPSLHCPDAPVSPPLSAGPGIHKIPVGMCTTYMYTLSRTHRHFYPRNNAQSATFCPLVPCSLTTCEKKLAKLSKHYG